MGHRGPRRAVILAAGMGSRLVEQDAPPKPLKDVAGVPLLVRVLRTLQREGIREVVVVIGYKGEQIREALVSEPSLALKLYFVQNLDYDKKNGVSLLKAARFIDQDCVLSMADHLYSPDLVRRIRQYDLPRGEAVLAVDRDIERVFDIDDATKVRTEGGRIIDINKELPSYDCVDTGVFRIGPELVRELQRVYDATGDCSLSDGVHALASRGKFHVCDIGDARWIDVDTPQALERAEAMIRVFGETLGDEPGSSMVPITAEMMEGFAPSWVRAVKPYNEDHFEQAARNEGIARMMSNENPFAPSERVLRAVQRAALAGHLYPKGASELRERLGRREGFDESYVTLGNGSTELIDLVIRTFVSPGEEVLLSVPTFSMYEARTRAVGGVPVLVPMTEDNDFDIPGLLSAVTERTKLLFICTPNNPTGNQLDESLVRRILGLGLPTVLDEAYFEFADDPESLSHLVAEYPNAIVLRTFSKAYGLAGFRLGYAIAHPVVTKLLGRVKLPWNVSGITIAAAHAVLDDVDEFEARMERLRAGRAYLERSLSAIPGLAVVPSEGNFVLVDVRSAGISPQRFVEAMYERGVMIRLLSVHHAEWSYVRVTVGDESDNRRCVMAAESVMAEVGSRGADRRERANVLSQ